MKKSNKINIGLTSLAIIISVISLVYSSSQDRKIRKIQYDLNAISYKPIINVDSIEIVSFNENFDSAVFVGGLNDSTGLINVYSNINAKVIFYLKNSGNTNARIKAALCVDTISGDDKLRELFFKEGAEMILDSTNNDFYQFRQLQPNDVDIMEFETEIKFIKNETFAIHFLIFYENDLDILYDSYYWAKFQKRTLITGMRPINEKSNDNKLQMVMDKQQSVSFIDDNIAFKTYSKIEKREFDKIADKINNAR